MANESSAILGGVVGGLVFIGIAILVGDHFYEQCFNAIYHQQLGEYKCLSDDSVLKDGQCCTTKYSWQAWCCGLPFALIGIGIIGASLSAKEKNASEGQNSVSIKKDGNDVENTREKYDLGEEYSDKDIAFVNQWKNEIMEEENESEDETPSGKSENSLADELKKLNELKEQGIIDEDEFKTAKKKLLEQ